MKYITTMAVMLFISVTANAADVSLEAHAKAESGVFISAMLCTAHGFDCETAPVYVRANSMSRSALVALTADKLSVDQAQAVHDKVAHVRSLLDQATVACSQDNKTGKCTKSSRTAHKLLAQAKKALEG